MKKILVIDDEIGICEAVRFLFKDTGYQVIYALTGKKGLVMFEFEKPDIVILDMRLGDIFGLEILEQIKAKRPSCYVIVMTASCSPRNKKRALELGADYYLPKPFSVDTLRDIILRV